MLSNNPSPVAITPEGELPDYFVPLTPAERIRLKEKYRSTLRATKSALLISANSDSTDLVSPSPQRTLVLGSNSPKQFMHMHHMKTGEEAYSFNRMITLRYTYTFSHKRLCVSSLYRGHKFGRFNQMRTPETEGCEWWDDDQIQQHV
jgi:hypothetical protein